MTEKREMAEKKELQHFGLVMAVFVALMFGVVVPWLWGFGFPIWPWGVAAVLTVLAATAPAALKPVQGGWMRIGHLLNWLVSRVALVLVYFTIVLPIGMAMRAIDKNPIHRNFERYLKTYRVPAERPDRKHLERPF